MFDGRDPIQPLSEIRIARVPGGWPEGEGLDERIQAHWEAAVAANPSLWNGRVMATVAPGRPGGLDLVDGVLTGTAFETDYAAFLAWRAWGFPEVGVRNLFGSALVMSGDGALIYGRMSAGTANPGRIYPPGGNLEPKDVDPDGFVDVVGSIERELHEETGLDAAAACVEGQFVAFAGPLVSIGRLFRFEETAEALVARIGAFLATQDPPELAGVRAFRRLADLGGENVPQYARMYAERLLPA